MQNGQGPENARSANPSQRPKVALWVAAVLLVFFGLAAIAFIWSTVNSATDRVAWLAAIAVWVQALAVIVAFLVAFSQVAESRRLRLETLRPFVIVTLESTVGPFVDIVIRNIGPIIAKEVRFEYEKPLKRGTEERYSGAEAILDAGLASIAPGQEVRTIFEYANDRLVDGKPDPDLPHRWEVRVKYSDSELRPFEEEQVLDLQPVLARIYIDRKDIHDVHAELKKIRELFAKREQRIERIARAEADEAKRRADAIGRTKPNAVRWHSRLGAWLKTQR